MRRGRGYNWQDRYSRQGAAAPAGYAAWPSLIGAEMMTNGDCSSGTGWTLGAGVVIAAGKMTATASSASTENAGAPGSSFIQGATYRTVFTIDTASVGQSRMIIGTAPGTFRSTVATFSQDIVADGVPDEGGWFLETSGATMQLDNFSVKSVGLMGVSGDWTFGGDTFFGNGAVQFDDLGGSTAALTGSALTAFDAAVSNSTACTVTITAGASGFDGTIEVSLKGGTAVQFAFSVTPSEAVAHTVTSGAGSGFEMESVTACAGDIPRIQISLA